MSVQILKSQLAQKLSQIYCRIYRNVGKGKDKGKGKVIPLQAWTGPEVFRRLRLSDFKTIGI
jgi:hypothetical protein